MVTLVSRHWRGCQQAPDGPCQRPHSQQQQQGVGEGRQDAALLPAVGMARVRLQLARQRATPCQHESCHVAEVVPIGQQCQRIDRPAIEGLDADKGQIQSDADCKRLIEVGGCMVVGMFGSHSMRSCATAQGLVQLIDALHPVRVLLQASRAKAAGAGVRKSGVGRSGAGGKAGRAAGNRRTSLPPIGQHPSCKQVVEVIDGGFMACLIADA